MLLLKRVGTTAAPAVPCSEATGKRKPRTRSLLLGVREGETPTPKHSVVIKNWISHPFRCGSPLQYQCSPVFQKPVLKKGIPRFPSFLPCVPEACPLVCRRGSPAKIQPKAKRSVLKKGIPSPPSVDSDHYINLLKKSEDAKLTNARGDPQFSGKNQDSRPPRDPGKEIQSQPFIRRFRKEHVDGVGWGGPSPAGGRIGEGTRSKGVLVPS